MKKNFEELTYFITILFAWFVITLQVIALIFRILK